MIVGYVRVSSFEQNEERQIEELKNFGVEKFFSEKISARAKVRPQFEEMMRFLREGDTLVVSEFSRLARSTGDLLRITETLNQKGVEVKSLKENLDTSTPQGKFMLTIFGAIAEFERDLLLQRQREGIRIAQAAGKYKGRHEKSLLLILTTTKNFGTTIILKLPKLHDVSKFAAQPYISGCANNFLSL